MGRDLDPTIFRQADEILGFELSKLIWEGPEDVLTETVNAQPAIFVASIAALRAIRLPADVAFTAGHSVGEYSALVASEVLTFEEGLMLVQARGQLMQRASSDIPGGMLAVLGVDDAVIDAACASVAPLVVCAANYNAPGQTIVSGEERGLEAVSEALKARGAKRILRLNVSAAFHSPVMEAPAAQLQSAIDRADVRRARWPVLANASAKPLSQPEDIRAELAHQIASPVRWEQSVRHMVAAGATRLLEVGPGKVLTGLAKHIDPAVEAIALSDRAAIDAFNAAA